MFFVSRPPPPLATPYRSDIFVEQQRAPRHGRRKRLFLQQPCWFLWRQVLPPMSTLMVSSPRSLCLTSLCFDLGALSQQFFPTIYLVGCHKSKRPKCFQHLRHCVVRIQRGGIWRCDAREEQEPITFLYITQNFPFATPNLLTYGIVKRVRIYSHSQIKCIPRCLN